MRNSIKILAIITLVTVTLSLQAAVDIIECEDEQGNRSFHQTCPPGSKQVSKRSYSTSTPDAGNSVPSLSTTLYVVPDCESCDQVREFLAVRNISITEKDVSDDAQLQEELKDKTGGDLRVPVLLLGNDVLSGYNRTALLQALANAGYTETD